MKAVAMAAVNSDRELGDDALKFLDRIGQSSETPGRAAALAREAVAAIDSQRLSVTWAGQGPAVGGYLSLAFAQRGHVMDVVPVLPGDTDLTVRENGDEKITVWADRIVDHEDDNEGKVFKLTLSRNAGYRGAAALDSARGSASQAEMEAWMRSRLIPWLEARGFDRLVVDVHAYPTLLTIEDFRDSLLALGFVPSVRDSSVMIKELAPREGNVLEAASVSEGRLTIMDGGSPNSLPYLILKAFTNFDEKTVKAWGTVFTAVELTALALLAPLLTPFWLAFYAATHTGLEIAAARRGRGPPVNVMVNFVRHFVGFLPYLSIAFLGSIGTAAALSVHAFVDMVSIWGAPFVRPAYRSFARGLKRFVAGGYKEVLTLGRQDARASGAKPWLAAGQMLASVLFIMVGSDASAVADFQRGDMANLGLLAMAGPWGTLLAGLAGIAASFAALVGWAPLTLKKEEQERRERRILSKMEEPDWTWPELEGQTPMKGRGLNRFIRFHPVLSSLFARRLIRLIEEAGPFSTKVARSMGTSLAMVRGFIRDYDEVNRAWTDSKQKTFERLRELMGEGPDWAVPKQDWTFTKLYQEFNLTQGGWSHLSHFIFEHDVLAELLAGRVKQILEESHGSRSAVAETLGVTVQAVEFWEARDGVLKDTFDAHDQWQARQLLKRMQGEAWRFDEIAGDMGMPLGYLTGVLLRRFPQLERPVRRRLRPLIYRHNGNISAIKEELGGQMDFSVAKRLVEEGPGRSSFAALQRWQKARLGRAMQQPGWIHADLAKAITPNRRYIPQGQTPEQFIPDVHLITVLLRRYQLVPSSAKAGLTEAEPDQLRWARLRKIKESRDYIAALEEDEEYLSQYAQEVKSGAGLTAVWALTLLRRLQDKPFHLAPRRILDAGSGPSVLAAAAQRAGGPWIKADVVDLEVSSRMLEKGREILPGLRDGRQAVGSLARIPLADKSMDMVYAGFSLDQVAEQDRWQALKEIHRVLAEGGYAVIVVPLIVPSAVLAGLTGRGFQEPWVSPPVDGVQAVILKKAGPFNVAEDAFHLVGNPWRPSGQGGGIEGSKTTAPRRLSVPLMSLTDYVNEGRKEWEAATSSLREADRRSLNGFFGNTWTDREKVETVQSLGLENLVETVRLLQQRGPLKDLRQLLQRGLPPRISQSLLRSLGQISRRLAEDGGLDSLADRQRKIREEVDLRLEPARSLLKGFVLSPEGVLLGIHEVNERLRVSDLSGDQKAAVRLAVNKAGAERDPSARLLAVMALEEDMERSLRKQDGTTGDAPKEGNSSAPPAGESNPDARGRAPRFLSSVSSNEENWDAPLTLPGEAAKSARDRGLVWTPEHMRNYKEHRAMVRPALEAIIRDEVLPVLDGRVVLELGAGAGALRDLAGDSLPSDVDWVESDQDASFLEMPRRYQTRKRVGKLPNLDLPDGSAAAVVGLNILSVVPSEIFGQTMAEAYRLLEPGGRLVHLADAPHIGMEAEAAAAEGLIMFPALYGSEGEMAAYYVDEQDFRRAINNLGLEPDDPSFVNLTNYLEDPAAMAKTLLDSQEFGMLAAFAGLVSKLGLVSRVEPSLWGHFSKRLEAAARAAGFQVESAGSTVKSLEVDRAELPLTPASHNEVTLMNGFIEYRRNPSIAKDKIRVTVRAHLFVARRPEEAEAGIPSPGPGSLPAEIGEQEPKEARKRKDGAHMPGVIPLINQAESDRLNAWLRDAIPAAERRAAVLERLISEREKRPFDNPRDLMRRVRGLDSVAFLVLASRAETQHDRPSRPGRSPREAERERQRVYKALGAGPEAVVRLAKRGTESLRETIVEVAADTLLTPRKEIFAGLVREQIALDQLPRLVSRLLTAMFEDYYESRHSSGVLSDLADAGVGEEAFSEAVPRLVAGLTHEDAWVASSCNYVLAALARNQMAVPALAAQIPALVVLLAEYFEDRSARVENILTALAVHEGAEPAFMDERSLLVRGLSAEKQEARLAFASVLLALAENGRTMDALAGVAEVLAGSLADSHPPVRVAMQKIFTALAGRLSRETAAEAVVPSIANLSHAEEGVRAASRETLTAFFRNGLFSDLEAEAALYALDLPGGFEPKNILKDQAHEFLLNLARTEVKRPALPLKGRYLSSIGLPWASSQALASLNVPVRTWGDLLETSEVELRWRLHLKSASWQDKTQWRPWSEVEAIMEDLRRLLAHFDASLPAPLPISLEAFIDRLEREHGLKSARLYALLQKKRIRDLDDLSEWVSRHDLLSLPGVGPKMADAVRTLLAAPEIRGYGKRMPRASWRLTVWFTERVLNRMFPRHYGGRYARRREVAPMAITRAAPWFEPAVVLGFIPAVSAAALALLGVDFSWPVRVGVSLLSHAAFVMGHWDGVYMPRETGPPGFSKYVDFKDPKNRHKRRPALLMLFFIAGPLFHLPFYAAFTFLPALGPALAVGSLSLSAGWAVYSHARYNRGGLRRWREFFIRHKFPLATAGGDKEGAPARDYITNPFPLLAGRDAVTRVELMRALNGKYPARVLMAGGPIRQPDRFAAIKRDSAAHRVRGLTGREVHDASYPEDFAEPATVLNINEVAAAVAADPASMLPLVFKPNAGAMGENVAFFTGSLENDSVRVTVADVEDMGTPLTDTTAIMEYLRGKNLAQSLQTLSGQDILQFSVPRAQLPDVLPGLWRLLAANPWSGRYDSGMIETVMPVQTYNGLAFETRHIVRGDLFSGNVNDLMKEAWYARLGSSSFFSNKEGRSGAQGRRWPDMFQPLYEMFGVPDNRRTAFQAHVDKLIKEQFAYIAARLRMAGIRAETEVRTEFDLMWLLPQQDGEFPVPVIIESSFHLPQKKDLDRFPVIDPRDDENWGAKRTTVSFPAASPDQPTKKNTSLDSRILDWTALVAGLGVVTVWRLVADGGDRGGDNPELAGGPSGAANGGSDFEAQARPLDQFLEALVRGYQRHEKASEVSAWAEAFRRAPDPLVFMGSQVQERDRPGRYIDMARKIMPDVPMERIFFVRKDSLLARTFGLRDRRGLTVNVSHNGQKWSFALIAFPGPDSRKILRTILHEGMHLTPEMGVPIAAGAPDSAFRRGLVEGYIEYRVREMILAGMRTDWQIGDAMMGEEWREEAWNPSWRDRRFRYMFGKESAYPDELEAAEAIVHRIGEHDMKEIFKRGDFKTLVALLGGKTIELVPLLKPSSTLPARIVWQAIEKAARETSARPSERQTRELDALMTVLRWFKREGPLAITSLFSEVLQSPYYSRLAGQDQRGAFLRILQDLHKTALSSKNIHDWAMDLFFDRYGEDESALQERIRRTLKAQIKDSLENPSLSRGGLIPRLRGPLMRLSGGREWLYRYGTAPGVEEFLVVLASTALGLLGLSMMASYMTARVLFVAAHFGRDERGERAPPGSFAAAGLISILNVLALGFISFTPLAVFLAPFIHSAVNWILFKSMRGKTAWAPEYTPAAGVAMSKEMETARPLIDVVFQTPDGGRHNLRLPSYYTAAGPLHETSLGQVLKEAERLGMDAGAMRRGWDEHRYTFQIGE
ncbi:MAG: methyltransferase domain-containing protein, partial [Elusimicrobiota bacterium]